MRPSRKNWLRPRWREAFLLALATLLTFLGFSMNEIAYELRSQGSPISAFPLVIGLTFRYALPIWIVHLVLCWRKLQSNQLLWPLYALIVGIGLIMINRVGGTDLAIDQIERGLWPGVAAIVILLRFPSIIERLMRQRWAVLLLVAGSLGLLVVAAFLTPGESIDTGGNVTTGTEVTLPFASLAIQTTEFVKVAMIFLLAWFLDWLGEDAGQAEYVWHGIAYPKLDFLLPGVLYFGVASMLLFWIQDLGALLILAPLFVVLLYAGLRPRVFFSVALTAGIFVLVSGALLFQFVDVPLRVQDRWDAFRDPWSHELSVWYGEPIYLSSGVQLQQAAYGTIAGGLWGEGIGFGHARFIPLALSDFILAATAEELGLVVVAALLLLYLLLFWRILRVAILLPTYQLFERCVLIGISMHLVLQLFFMAAGTWGLFVMTGITVPFMSKGGVALAINSAEIGLVLALALRSENRHA